MLYLKEVINILLKFIRQERELTQKQVADHIGVTTQTLSNWERSVTEPDIDSLKRLARLYDVSIDFLLEYNYVDNSISINEFQKLDTSIFIEAVKSILTRQR